MKVSFYKMLWANVLDKNVKVVILTTCNSVKISSIKNDHAILLLARLINTHDTIISILQQCIT